MFCGQFGLSKHKYFSKRLVIKLAFLLLLNCNVGQSSHARRFEPPEESQEIQDMDLTLEGNELLGNLYLNQPAEEQTDAKSKFDDEDRRLIEKFYQDIKDERREVESDDEFDKFLAETDASKAPKALTDSIPYGESSSTGNNDLRTRDGWTIDTRPANKQLVSTNVQQRPSSNFNYSPIFRLLTTYNPTGAQDESGYKFVGATAVGGDSGGTIGGGSKSAVDAIKMHDELLEEAPRDGKVRVRMYYHRATHDDPKLYGTGPWKYYGNGWGVEFGYDPKESTEKRFFEKGYTIERAFGRDFCKTKENCRKPDPSFFQSMSNAGKYSQSTSNDVN